jgi:hypothetical protein
MPRAARTDEAKAYRASFAPGPGAYEVRRDDKQEGTAKSILGGSLDAKGIIDNGVPGPGSYNAKHAFSLPGFKIMPRQEKEEEDLSDEAQAMAQQPVGPQRYNPVNPTHTSNGVVIGSGTRDGLKQKFFTPAPNAYSLKTDFEKATDKPKFHMGIKGGARSNKNLDMPGPGEYETDVIPQHHSNPAHVIGTSIRSDLGVGKAHLAPGPGEYENRMKNDGPKVG